MEAAYFKAAIPEPFRILGLPLLPLSLGRYRLLRRFECNFVADGQATATVADLLLGCVICSMPVAEFLELLRRPRKLERALRRWGRRVCPHPWIGVFPWLGKWWRKNHHFDVTEKMALFQRYITEGSAQPPYWDDGEDSRPSGAHWSQCVEVVLRGHLGWTAEEVNEQPLTKALADYYKHAENNGIIRLMTPDELAQAEAATNGA